jgi:transcriptional regulator with XRE-family HTH domain
MTVFDRVKALADEKKLTIKAVETSCGLSNGSISKWSTSTPKVDALYQVALFFGESIEYFLTGIRSSKSADEDIIINAYRVADAEGRARITQVAMNVRDDIEKRI